MHTYSMFSLMFYSIQAIEYSYVCMVIDNLLLEASFDFICIKQHKLYRLAKTNHH